MTTSNKTKYYSLPVLSKEARRNSNLATNLATAGLFSAIAACGGDAATTNSVVSFNAFVQPETLVDGIRYAYGDEKTSAIYINKDLITGGVLGTIAANNAGGDTYSIIGADGYNFDGNVNDYFAIDSSGKLELKDTKALDITSSTGGNSHFTVTVQAGSGESTGTHEITIHLGDIYIGETTNLGVVTMTFGAGDDFVVGVNDSDSDTRYTFRGGDGNDYISGGDRNDVIYGDGDNDILYGNGGADSIHGGDSDDIIYGGADGDTINGGEGHDKLYGDAGVDTIDGDAGDDIIYGGADGDIINGGEGHDKLYGDAGKDTINGNAGDDIIYGGADGDTINGGEGHDKLYGGDGVDYIDGGAGNDIIDAGAGKGTAIGGAGNDMLIGNSGTDHFSFRSGNVADIGSDVIKGFTRADEDKIQFYGGGLSFDGSNPIAISYTADSGNAVITGHGDNNSILTVEGWDGATEATRLVASDFTFGS